MENITKYLIEKLGFKKESIALRVGASVRSVERWQNGGVPFHVYQKQLEQLFERQKGKKV